MSLNDNYNSLLNILDTINNLPESGGGVELPLLNNPGSASDLLSGKELIDQDGNKVTGTIVTKTSSDLTASGATVTVPAGYYAASASKSVSTTTQATPSITVNSSGLITASTTQNAGYVSSGTKSATKQLTTQSAKTITPSTSSQTAVDSGRYTTGAVTVQGDSNLVANNIKSGVSIFGVTGTYEGSGGGGSGNISPKDINFYDYDGTLLYSYTIVEAQALTSLPELPTHDGLTCQGWNWTLTQIKAENSKVNVGAMYITDDGKTKIYIHLEDNGRLSPMLGLGVNGTVTVDWGDGSISTLTGTDMSTIIFTSNHTYASAGDYVIKLIVSDSANFLGISSGYSSLLCFSNGSDGRNCVYNNAIRKIEIGSKIENIDENAFYGCYSLSSITIPSSVKGIGQNAFNNCHSLSSITIPLSATSIGDYAFYDCSSLASITIPNSVTSIGNRAFNNCSSLMSITIPDGVTSIGYYAFSGCSNLTNITIPNSVTSIGTYAFYLCYNLLNIIIHSKITSIEERTFQGCNSLSSITIPSKVTSIGQFAIAACKSLLNITIPSSVKTINAYAFSGCGGVSYYDFSSHTSVPTLSSTNAFGSIPADCQIRVPNSLLGSWKSATNWSTYAGNIVGV